jgi:hypothetical protein
MTGAKTATNIRLEQQPSPSGTSTLVRKVYPGASLKHLGSVRDVTLTKTKRAPEGAGTKHT